MGQVKKCTNMFSIHFVHLANLVHNWRRGFYLHVCLDSALLRVTYHYVISFPTIFISRRYYAMFVSLISAISHALMTEIVDYFINSTPPLPFEDLGTWHFGSGPIFWSSLACRKPLFKILILRGVPIEIEEIFLIPNTSFPYPISDGFSRKRPMGLPFKNQNFEKRVSAC